MWSFLRLPRVEWSEDVSFPDAPEIPPGYRGKTLPVTRKGADFYVGNAPLEGPAKELALEQYGQFCGFCRLIGCMMSGL